MLKRSGRGHDPAGIESTLDGECAVECPACPHPGKNLPDGWEDAPEYILYVIICGEFAWRLTTSCSQMDLCTYPYARCELQDETEREGYSR